MIINKRRALFLLAGGLAGLVSGAMMLPVFGVRGAILGLALSAGAIMLHQRRQRGPAAPGLPFTALLSLALSVAAWACILAWDSIVPAPSSQDFEIDHLTPGAAGAACFLQIALVLLGYRARITRTRGAWIWFSLAPAAGAVVRALSMGEIEAIPYAFFIGNLPFVALWLVAARLCDPGWKVTSPPQNASRR